MGVGVVDTRKLLVVKPVGILAGSAVGIAFRSLWRKADGGRDVPDPADTARSWRTVLFAAALQGAAFALVHAVIERSLARRPEQGQSG